MENSAVTAYFWREPFVPDSRYSAAYLKVPSLRVTVKSNGEVNMWSKDHVFRGPQAHEKAIQLTDAQVATLQNAMRNHAQAQKARARAQKAYARAEVAGAQAVATLRTTMPEFETLSNPAGCVLL